ncbi:hypothetical protein F2Q69_00030122 [Brassica cretica]|uniref:DUF1985 domain-containing protein n=1 Tax=Brassica cretica TaxID=69181 RepID=A0A8S9S4G0_BRACR|nr:hypothetical protein F2Q69_00030122 [Brassica cretica]
MKFGWASRLVHYILCFQLECKKKYELWSLVGVQPVRFSLHEFEEITGLNCEYVKNVENPLVESRDDRLRLGYLAIYAGFIEAPRTSSPTRVSLARLVMDLDAFEDYSWGRVVFKFLMESVKGVDLTKTYAIEGFVQVLQVWVYNFLPEFGAGFGRPIEGFPTPPLLAFLGGKGKRRLQENMLNQTRTNNFTMKDYSEMFPRWDGDLEDEKADNIVKAMFSSSWAWEQSHWPLVGTKLWTNVKVEIHPMKTKAGQMVRSKKAVSPYHTESEAESRKKARESPGLDTETMKAEIVHWLTGLTSNMVEGLSRCDNTLKTQSCMIEGLTAKMGAVEKIVREGWKEDLTKAGPSTDVPEANKSNGHKAKEDKAEESKAAETSPKPNIMTTRAKARDTQATVSENENEGISVVVVDKEQSRIDYGSVKKLKQVGKLKAARIVARAKSKRQRRLAATQHSPFNGNSTAKVIIPKRGQGYNPFTGVDRQKLSVLLDWVKLDPFWFYTLLIPTKWLNDTHMDARINLLRLRYTKHPERHDARINLLRLRYKKHPERFRSDRICMVDAVFTQMWTKKYSEFLASPANPDGSECHALGMPFPPHELCDKKIKKIRSQMATGIFDATSINGIEKRLYKHLGVYD